METLNYLFEEWRDIKGFEGLYSDLSQQNHPAQCVNPLLGL